MRTKCRGTQLAVDPDPAGGYKPRMARKARTPSYCHHKPRNLGYARLPDPDRPGRYVTVYFPGRYDSPESLGAYHAAIAEWRRTGRPPDLPRPAGDRRESLAVLELVDRFWDHVEQHGLYRKNGRPTSEIGCLRLAFRELLALRVRGRPVDTLPVAEFGVAEIDALRAAMVAKGWAARSIRIHLTRVRSLLRWGSPAAWCRPTSSRRSTRRRNRVSGPAGSTPPAGSRRRCGRPSRPPSGRCSPRPARRPGA
jgi:hypothetical protein